LDLKKKERTSFDLPFDGKLNSWDFRYYNRLLLESEYQVNDEEIKEYFSLTTVTQGMLDLYQTVLDLKFTEIPEPPVWHADVKLFEVRDRSSQDLVGYFYLDLFPRDGKYTHAACFGLQPGFEREDGTRQYPAAAMVANFTKPTADKPSLLKHNEVVTFYHELGHVMHQLCSQTRWSRFHGTKVERDFVEAPSQMLENWCWEADILRNLSAHYQRKDAQGRPEKIPVELCDRIVTAKNVNAGLMNLRQIFFASFDMTVHTLPASQQGKVDTTALYDRLRKEIALIPGPEGAFPAATFGHIMGGYDAGYYGYLWSQVFSADMYFTRFKTEGIDNVKTGKDYRLCILKPGGSQDGDDMLKAFLHREPNADAFLKSIGLS
jgi:Zn-dependent oligopeptidase